MNFEVLDIVLIQGDATLTLQDHQFSRIGIIVDETISNKLAPGWYFCEFHNSGVLVLPMVELDTKRYKLLKIESNPWLPMRCDTEESMYQRRITVRGMIKDQMKKGLLGKIKWMTSETSKKWETQPIFDIFAALNINLSETKLIVMDARRRLAEVAYVATVSNEVEVDNILQEPIE